MASIPSITGTWTGEAPENSELRKLSITVRQDSGIAVFSGTCDIDVDSVGRDLPGKASGTTGETIQLACKGEIPRKSGWGQHWSTHGTGTWTSDDEILYHDEIFEESLTLRRA